MLVSVAILPAGCFITPPEPPARPADPVFTVSYPEFLNRWRDAPQHAAGEWLGHKITMRFPVEGYSIVADGIAILEGRPGAGPVLVFQMKDPPRDSSKPIVVEGVCRGVTERKALKAGEQRQAGVHWLVTVEGCTWREQ